MLARSSKQEPVSGKYAVAVPRTMTSVGGFEVPLSGLPARPSGRTGVDGELLKPEMADAEDESKRLYFELQHGLVTMGEELFNGRHVVAEERAKALMMRLNDFRNYVQVMAKQHLVPFECPRCQTAKTHDPKGAGMCPACLEAAYSRPRIG